jgi:hypothetical protein
VLERGAVVREGPAAELTRDQAVVEAYLGARPANRKKAGAAAAPMELAMEGKP